MTIELIKLFWGDNMEKENKKRLMLMQSVLEKYSDDRHMLSTTQIIDILEKEYGMKVHRTTVSKDISDLIDMGIDVQYQRSTQNKYFLSSRQFELPELKLLVDAVASSKFITKKKSRELIEKLSSFTSIYQQEEIKTNIQAESRVKPRNERSFYIVDAINTAINNNKKIKFTYFDYNMNKEKVLRNDGKPYVFSPYSLVWNGDYYYMVGFSDKHGKIGSFRVDRIVSTPEILFATAVPMPDNFDISDFTKTAFQMYNGEITFVELKCTADMMKIIIDGFGEEVQTQIIDDEHFKVTVKVSLSPNFYGWLFKFSEKIQLLSPKSVINKYQEMLTAATKNYK